MPTSWPTRRPGWPTWKPSWPSTPRPTRCPRPCSSSPAPTSSTARRTWRISSTPRWSRTYAGTESAKKAAGSLRRLDLVGKPLALKGTGLQNESIDTAQYRGKTVLVVFWASWATPFKTELPELKKVAAKYRDRGLEVIGVNLDNERAEVNAFLKENPLTWPQIFEGGGLEGRLAVEYGITSVPTMFLADAQGKVINRIIRTAAELDRQLDKVLAAQKGTAGVALDSR